MNQLSHGKVIQTDIPKSCLRKIPADRIEHIHDHQHQLTQYKIFNCNIIFIIYI